MSNKTVGERIEFNFKAGEKVKISPIGDVVGYDGRTFTIDPKAIIKDVVEDNLHIMLDENHWDSRAMGWFDKASFEIRADGIYASLEPTPEGAELIANRSYRYLSPAFELDDKRNVIGIDSVGLVNKPNLLDNELNKKGDGMNELEKLKAQNEALLKELADIKTANETKTADEQKNANETKEADEQKSASDVMQAISVLTKQIEELKANNKELNTKMSVFGKTNLEQNSKTSDVLSDGEKNVAKLLGIGADEYIKTRNGDKN